MPITTSASQNALILSQVLAASQMKANMPSLPLIALAHHKNMDGNGSNTYRHPRESDLGISTGGTEGVAFSSPLEIGYDSSLELSPTEGVLDGFTITEDTVMRRLGGMGSGDVINIFESGSNAQRAALLGPDVERMMYRALRKVHKDGLDLLTGLSESVGLVTTDASIDELLEMRYVMRKNHAHGPISRWAFVEPASAIYAMEQEALTSTDLIGTIWNQADANFVNKPGDDWSETGSWGSFLGHPMYELAEEDVPTVTVDAATGVVGGMIVRPAAPGQAPDDGSLGKKVGTFVLVHRSPAGSTPVVFRFDTDINLRSLKCVVNARYIWGELLDKNGVKHISKQAA